MELEISDVVRNNDLLYKLERPLREPDLAGLGLKPYHDKKLLESMVFAYNYAPLKEIEKDKEKFYVRDVPAIQVNSAIQNKELGAQDLRLFINCEFVYLFKVEPATHKNYNSKIWVQERDENGKLMVDYKGKPVLKEQNVEYLNFTGLRIRI